MNKELPHKVSKYQIGGLVRKAIPWLDDIMRATKNSLLDFSDWGKRYRDDMMKIPGNKNIVESLSDSELGYLLYKRNAQILNGFPSRYATFNGFDINSVKQIDIFNAPSKKVGYLIPEYEDVVPGTVSTHYVENTSGGMAKRISEDAYNALMHITGNL